VREWHAAWLAERPEEATLEQMRRRLVDRAAAIRANPPPPGKEPKSFTRRDLSRLERIARRGALRLRFEQFRSLLRRDDASRVST
jgi:hypothetical protein